MSIVHSDKIKREWVITCGQRYWPANVRLITALPIPELPLDPPPGPLVQIDTPAWAEDIAVNGTLLAYKSCLAPSATHSSWKHCDWLAVAWHMLNGSAERLHELNEGPILSFSFRLPKASSLLYDHAWVNRIFLFLRRWAARERNIPDYELFGALPTATVELTHDVDAVTLTPEIRCKQTIFQLVNSARAFARRDIHASAQKLAIGARLAFHSGDFKTLQLVRDLEWAAGLRSTLHFYGGLPGLSRRSMKSMIIDPAYDVSSDYLQQEMKRLCDGGWTIGLHQSFAAWQCAELMKSEKQRLESVAETQVLACRQHWLHFSWKATWRAQEAAGLLIDSTLGFNDRPGFRTGHALRVHPWDCDSRSPMRLSILPMVFMDSHFYDYADADQDVYRQMKVWLDEIIAVGGEATVNWHTHTITAAYGWRSGFEHLLALLTTI